MVICLATLRLIMLGTGSTSKAATACRFGGLALAFRRFPGVAPGFGFLVDDGKPKPYAQRHPRRVWDRRTTQATKMVTHSDEAVDTAGATDPLAPM